MPDWKEFERMVFGRSSVPSGGVVPPPTPSLSPFRQPMQWIKSALGLQKGNPPQDLNTGQIIPQLDAFQNGWPFAVYRAPTLVAVIGVAGAFSRIIVVAPDNKIIQRLMAVQIDHGAAAGAAPITIVFRLGPVEFAGTAVRGSIAQVTLAPGGMATYVDIFGSYDVIVPPGLTLTMESQSGAAVALVAGETIDLTNGVIQQIPAGFHP